MFHKIKEIKTCDDLKLQAEFTNGVKKEYNVRNIIYFRIPKKLAPHNQFGLCDAPFYIV